MKRSLKKSLIIIGCVAVVASVLFFSYRALFCHFMPYQNIPYSIEQNLSGQFDVKACPYDRTGFAYYYIKTDQKNKNKCQEWVYYPSAARSESFKIYRFAKLQNATDLVCADYDLTTFMPSLMSAYLVRPNGERVLNATTKYSSFSGTTSFKNSEQRFRFGVIPSYFYNFDWVDLISMVPYLKDKHSDFYAGFISPNNSFQIQYQGKTKYLYQGIQTRGGIPCDVFTVVVEGLESKEGKIYIDSDNYDVVEITMELPDNPGYESFKFALRGKQRMTQGEWDDFITAKTKEAL